MSGSATTRTLQVKMRRPGQAEPTAPAGDVHGGAQPLLWLGAEAAGALALPMATASSHQLYAPRGVWLDDQRLIVADTGNHRVLLWHDVGAMSSHQPADIVLGQPDFDTEGAQAAGRGPERGVHLPTGVLVHEDRLVIADAWNHRILIWNRVPESSDVAPDLVIGQTDAESVDKNRGGDCNALGLYWPFGIAMIGSTFYVTDTGNRRVLGWHGLPEPDTAPDILLGQPDLDAHDENRGELGPASFRWPHDLAGDGDRVFVADAGNHRLLAWHPTIDRDRPADQVLGQPDFVSNREFPYAPQTAEGMRFPYAVDLAGDLMAVADTANNRVLLWDGLPMDDAAAATRVLGQPDFGANGENRWQAVEDDTFCWPYGLSLCGSRLAVADSGNNRVMLWDLG